MVKKVDWFLRKIVKMSKMTDISSLPDEVLLHLFSFLPSSSLVSVWRTSTQWRDLSTRPLAARIQSSWAAAAALVTSADLAEDVICVLVSHRHVFDF